MKTVFRILKQWWNKRLSHRVIALVITICFIFLFAQGFFTVQLGQGIITQLITSHNDRLAREVSEEITLFFQQVVDIMRLQGDEILSESDPERQSRLLFIWKKQFSYSFGDLYLLDDQGNVRLSLTGHIEEALSRGAQKYLPAIQIDLDPSVQEAIKTRKITASSVKFSPFSLSPYLFMSLPLIDPKGSFQGALVAQIDLRILRIRLDNFQKFDGFVSIVDSRGMILASTDGRQIGRIWRKPDASKMNEGSEKLLSYFEHKYLTAYSSVSRFVDWQIVVQEIPNTLHILTQRIAIGTIAFTLVSGVIVFFLLSWIIQKALSPIESLSQTASGVAKDGKLGHEILFKKSHEYYPSSEIGLLISSFNDMAKSLKQAHEELEMRVRERTAELVKINEMLQIEINDRKRAEEEILKLNEELKRHVTELEETRMFLEHANRAKSDFLANMSHELRTPLNAIIGFSDVLKDQYFGKLNERQQDYVDNILTSGKHLLDLINDILDLSKVEAGKLEFESSLILLKDVFDTSMFMVKEKAMAHGIKLSLEMEPETNIEIEADATKLKQIMFNLLSNAVKFTPDGGSVRVQARRITLPFLPLDKGRLGGVNEGERVSDSQVLNFKKKIIYSELRTQDSELDADFIEISVEDTGIGIKPQDMGKLFNEFSQIESGYTKKYQGAGLGLALTRKLVELHGGRIWAESEFGKGSKFTFVIPVKQEPRLTFPVS